MEEKNNSGCGALALMVAASILVPLMLLAIVTSSWTGCRAGAGSHAPEMGFAAESRAWDLMLPGPAVLLALVLLLIGAVLFRSSRK